MFNTAGNATSRTPLGKRQLRLLTKGEADQVTFSLAVHFLVCLFYVVRLYGLAFRAKVAPLPLGPAI